MLDEHSFKRVVILIGPTAVGKTELSLRLAERLEGEIVSADSRLIYRGMDIGTAKPTEEERLRVPHHLIDLAEPNDPWSLAVYQQELMQCVQKIAKRNKLPIVVGGTGQYIRAFMEGWRVPTVKPDLPLRQVLESWGTEIGAPELHRKVQLLDPKAAADMDANNLRRSVRALEVIFNTGRLFSEQKEKNPPDLEFKMIGLMRSREELYARVDARIEKMFSDGLVDEVGYLLEKGFSSELPTFSAIGYHEVAEALEGRGSLEEAREVMKRKTRLFIRRQANWFKPTDPDIEWHCMHPDPLEAIIRSIQAWQGAH